MKVVLWDWNGTLLDDVDAEVTSLNAMLVRLGHKPISLEFFRDHFAFPSRVFYQRLGMYIPDDEWDDVAKEYHDTYHQQTYGLNADAVAALELAKERGAGQSVISALHQLYLDLETQRYGVKPYMDYVYGTNNLDGGSKLERAKELLSNMLTQNSKLQTSNFVLIGDSIHDKEVADELGIKCVLFSGGSHSRKRLEPLAPVGDTLEECVRLAFEI